MDALPEQIRDARLLGMLLASVTLLAERARAIEDSSPLRLSPDAFTANLIDMATGMLTAPGRVTDPELSLDTTVGQGLDEVR